MCDCGCRPGSERTWWHEERSECCAADDHEQFLLAVRQFEDHAQDEIRELLNRHLNLSG